MGILSWIILGLIIGALARFLMPGDDPAGFFLTIILGVAGALVGGFIGSALGLGSVDGFNFGSIVLATAGAMLLLFARRKLTAG
jgi:uncharacterized membrane protein YeaQ/YmgE (transglycosylase-associated protein family)